MVAVTPGTLSKSLSTHQKQPPANVATACPGGTAGGAASAAADSIAKAIGKAFSMGFLIADCLTLSYAVAGHYGFKRAPRAMLRRERRPSRHAPAARAGCAPRRKIHGQAGAAARVRRARRSTRAPR